MAIAGSRIVRGSGVCCLCYSRFRNELVLAVPDRALPNGWSYYELRHLRAGPRTPDRVPAGGGGGRAASASRRRKGCLGRPPPEGADESARCPSCRTALTGPESATLAVKSSPR